MSEDIGNGQENIETDHSNKNPINEIELKRRNLRETTSKPKRININYKCHICRDKKDNGKVLVCMNYQVCHHTFCHGCIDRNFRARAKKECLKIGESNWPCFACRGLCKCKRCKKALVEELNQLNNERSVIEDYGNNYKEMAIQSENEEDIAKDKGDNEVE